MAHAFSDIYIHLTFSTYRRHLYLGKDARDFIFPYMIGIMNNLNAPVLRIGGADEHVHILFRMPKDRTLMELIMKVKANSSRHIKTKGTDCEIFSWQEGYCAISVSPSAVDRVSRYIDNQEKHHQTRSYRDEILSMLRNGNINLDEE
ncbi:MAG: IS200/IS605 family transposase [Bacteroidota bacterium]